MQRLNAILKALALATIPVVGAFACVLLFQVSGAVETLKKQGVGTLTGVNQALATINNPKSGTLSMLDDTIVQGRLTIDAVNKVALHEQTQLGTLDADIALLVGQTSQTLGAVQGTAKQTTGSLAELTHSASGTLEAAKVSINTLPPLVGRATLFVGDADTFVKTLPPISANVQKVTAQAAIITTDAKVAEQRFVYPPKTPWYQRLGQDVLVTGRIAYRFFF